jgi:hypothetical protein
LPEATGYHDPEEDPGNVRAPVRHHRVEDGERDGVDHEGSQPQQPYYHAAHVLRVQHQLQKHLIPQRRGDGNGGEQEKRRQQDSPEIVGQLSPPRPALPHAPDEVERGFHAAQDAESREDQAHGTKRPKGANVRPVDVADDPAGDVVIERQPGQQERLESPLDAQALEHRKHQGEQRYQ